MKASQRKAEGIRRLRREKSVKYYASPNHDVLNRIGCYWDDKEQRALINRFIRGVTLDQMCRFHRRDVGGITSRLLKMGVIRAEGHSHINNITNSVFTTFEEIKEIKKRLQLNIDRKLRVMNDES